MTLPAAPAAPARDAVKAWDQAYRDLDKEVSKWVSRTRRGKPPLSISEQQRLRTLIAGIKTLYPMPDGNAQVAAWGVDAANTAARRSLQASLDSLGPHVVATVTEDAAKLGWRNVANRNALAAIVEGRTGALTADFTNLTKTVQTRLISALQTGVSLGESPFTTARRIKDIGSSTMRFGQSRSVLIARTQLAAAYDQASQASYMQAASDGVVNGWEWEAFEDDRTCPICSELDGKVFDVEMPTYRHPNCRCAMLPVVTGSTNSRKAHFTGNNRVTLQTGDTGWTHWVAA